MLLGQLIQWMLLSHWGQLYGLCPGQRQSRLFAEIAGTLETLSTLCHRLLHQITSFRIQWLFPIVPPPVPRSPASVTFSLRQSYQVFQCLWLASLSPAMGINYTSSWRLVCCFLLIKDSAPGLLKSQQLALSTTHCRGRRALLAVLAQRNVCFSLFFQKY